MTQSAKETLCASRRDTAEPAPADGPRLVGELVDPCMEELLGARYPGVTDLVLPAELASGTLVQFALQPELRGVYSEARHAAAPRHRPSFCPPAPR